MLLGRRLKSSNGRDSVFGIIPVLCAKAGVDMQDAKGRITGHRGRSTRLTLLRRNGVNLEDLAEYAGHADSRTIRRYARQDPLQLHRIIRDAVMYNPKSSPWTPFS